MRRTSLIIFTLAISIFACTQIKDETQRWIKFSGTINENPISAQSKILLTAVYGKDTVLFNSVSDSIPMPEFDSAIVFFKVSIDSFTTELSGQILTYELPHMISTELDRWNIEIDSPPLSSKNESMYKPEYGELDYYLFR